jgi:hypothetical protein
MTSLTSSLHSPHMQVEHCLTGARCNICGAWGTFSAPLNFKQRWDLNILHDSFPVSNFMLTRWNSWVMAARRTKATQVIEQESYLMIPANSAGAQFQSATHSLFCMMFALMKLCSAGVFHTTSVKVGKFEI